MCNGQNVNNRPELNVPQNVSSCRCVWPHPMLVFGLCLALLAVLGWVDYATGYELGFFVFYSLPVGLAAWYVGRWPAVFVALAASVTWWLADYLSGAKYSSPFYYYWNSTVHFLSFVINAVTIAKIKSDLDRRHALALQLEAARQALRSVAPLLAVCPRCGARRGGNLQAKSPPAPLTEQIHPELKVALCSDCRASDSAGQANGVRPGACHFRPVSTPGGTAGG